MFLKNQTYEFYSYRTKFVKNMYIFKKRLSGRNAKGSIIFYHRGGGIKRYFKIIDFFRFFRYIPAKVIRIEYDINRLHFLCLLCYLNGCLSYIISPSLINLNDFIYSNYKNFLNIGAVFLLYRIPLGIFISHLELYKFSGSKFSRSAGTGIQLLKKIGLFILVRLSSKEERFLSLQNSAVLGKNAYDLKKFIFKSKAGDNRKIGFKSIVRGVVKNPIDHPHGGGEGRTTAGQPSVSPWGIYTKGIRTTTRFNRQFINLKWGFFKRRTGLMW
jgi:large subunit ribosomal protein L2